jgi:DNA-binding transcriptional regulator YdaS (Cro superfamily)
MSSRIQNVMLRLGVSPASVSQTVARSTAAARCNNCGARVEVDTDGDGGLVDLDPVTFRPHVCKTVARQRARS